MELYVLRCCKRVGRGDVWMERVIADGTDRGRQMYALLGLDDSVVSLAIR